MAGGESGILVVLTIHLGRGGLSAPADRIHKTVEVPPAEVELCATRHHGHRDGLPGGRGCVVGNLPPGPLLGGHGSDPR